MYEIHIGTKTVVYCHHIATQPRQIKTIDGMLYTVDGGMVRSGKTHLGKIRRVINLAQYSRGYRADTESIVDALEEGSTPRGGHKFGDTHILVMPAHGVAIVNNHKTRY